MKQTAFERYAPFIQEYIYRKGWTDLRQVQIEACEAILDGDSNIVIASGTASGKTEAAFFPILTLLEQSAPESVGVLYISPLKALINDQFERLNELLNDSGIPVWPWHGDAPQSMKRRALKQARGVVQITPESLEAMLMRHPGDACRLFSDLRFIVIDEIHALMGEDRGLQVICLIARLERLTGCRPRRIGLSATLNDYRPAMVFVSAGSGRDATAVGIQTGKRTISLSAESFVLPQDEAGSFRVMREYYNFLYDNSHLRKCLIFANSRNSAEKIIANLKEIAQERGERDVFRVHHGSVSAELRRETEEALRDGEGPTVAAATLTLELGVDIGDLDTTVQAGAPYSCASFVQRLGRSGRRSGRSQMLFVSLHREEDGSPLDALPWELLRSIAVVQMYLEERWVEPYAPKRKPFSLLAHQTLSALMANVELTPRELAQNVLRLPPFADRISAEEYRELLRYMVEQDFLQRLTDGGLIVGLKGERITGHYSFYGVFQEEESYSVVAQEGEIGTLAECPKVGATFALAGASWQVLAVDEKRRKIFVQRASGVRVPSWSGAGGSVHARVVERMRQVLAEDAEYPYLQPSARTLLQRARELARQQRLLEHPVLPCGGRAFCLCPWTGTKELQTIERLLSCGLKAPLKVLGVVNRRHFLIVESGLEAETFVRELRNVEVDSDDPASVLPENHAPRVDKYDWMVPEPLLRTAFLYNQMDIPAALGVLRDIGSDC